MSVGTAESIFGVATKWMVARAAAAAAAADLHRLELLLQSHHLQ